MIYKYECAMHTEIAVFKFRKRIVTCSGTFDNASSLPPLAIRQTLVMTIILVHDVNGRLPSRR